MEVGGWTKWQADKLQELQPTRAATSPVQLLIEAGANLSAKNHEGLTPLMVAMQNWKRNKGTIRTIIEYSKPEEINEVDTKGCSVLHHLAKMQASTAFAAEITKVRISTKIDTFINQFNRKQIYSKTVIFQCQLLVGHGADITAENKEDYNPRDLARENGNSTVVDILSALISGTTAIKRKNHFH